LALTAADQNRHEYGSNRGLAGGGKASLLGIEIWRDDVNARGGLLGRKVELVVYDDKSSASETPAIYSKLLDVDKVDLLFAPYATVPTAPLMPLVKQRGPVADRQLLVPGEQQGWPRHVVQQCPVDRPTAGRHRSSISARRPAARPLRCSPQTRNSPRIWQDRRARSQRKRNMTIVFDQAYRANTVGISRQSSAALKAANLTSSMSSYPPDFGRNSARRERDRDRETTSRFSAAAWSACNSAR